MKKIFLLFFIIFLFGCSKPNNKIHRYNFFNKYYTSFEYDERIFILNFCKKYHTDVFNEYKNTNYLMDFCLDCYVKDTINPN